MEVADGGDSQSGNLKAFRQEGVIVDGEVVIICDDDDDDDDDIGGRKADTLLVASNEKHTKMEGKDTVLVMALLAL